MIEFVEKCILSCKRLKASEWLWRLAMLTLPWQTRIFVEGPSLSGYPWEQGRISFYFSMGIMIAYMLSVVVERRSERPLMIRPGMILGFSLLGLVTLLTTNRTATTMWLVQVVILISFFVNLTRDRLVRLESIVAWFCISLLPHAVLGIIQFFDQRVFASTLLGMSEQLPITPGVSVVETVGRRVLRAYGGFPHPNIFGGWLVFGTGGTLYLALMKKGKTSFVWMAVALLFATALFFTFSRSAWVVATILTITVLGFLFFKTTWNVDRSRIVRSASILTILLVLLGLWQSELILTRTQVTERLETKSFEERGYAIQLAEDVIAKHWVFGTGQGAYLYALVKTGVWDNRVEGPPIPPHNALILLFAELGVAGAIGAWLLGRGILKQITRRREWLHLRSLVFFAPVILLGLFDHYLWSYWSGQTLLALVIAGWAMTLTSSE